MEAGGRGGAKGNDRDGGLREEGLGDAVEGAGMAAEERVRIRWRKLGERWTLLEEG